MITTGLRTAHTPNSRFGADRVGRVLLWIAAAGAAGAAVSAISTVLGAGGTTKVVETWRLHGFVVFAGLFVLLALRPLAYRGVWELAVFNKLALTVTALAYAAHGGIGGTRRIIPRGGGPAPALIAAFLCCPRLSAL